MRLSVVLSALASSCAAHFLMLAPSSIGFDDDIEGTAPCGGFTPSLSSDSLSDIHVGGEAFAMRLVHPQGNWLFRATLDANAASGWEEVFPIVQQSGLGQFCEPQITFPASYIGQKGWVGVVSHTPDGILYQCIASNFVSGQGTQPSECANSSTTGSFVTDSQLSALVSGNASLGSNTMGMSGTTMVTTTSAPGSGQDSSMTTTASLSSSSDSSTTSPSSAASSTNAAASLHASHHGSIGVLGWALPMVILPLLSMGAFTL